MDIDGHFVLIADEDGRPAGPIRQMCVSRATRRGGPLCGIERGVEDSRPIAWLRLRHGKARKPDVQTGFGLRQLAVRTSRIQATIVARAALSIRIALGGGIAWLTPA